MQINKKEARYVAHEFAAMLLERALRRGDLVRYVRQVYCATDEGQPASVNNCRAAFDYVIACEWHKSMRFPPQRAKENIGNMQRAGNAFESLFPPERTDYERAEMARALEAHLTIKSNEGPSGSAVKCLREACEYWRGALGCCVDDFSKCPIVGEKGKR